jgi:hypothetical protein
LSDWDRNFPTSLKVLGGPKDIAERLIEMQTEINQLYASIDQLQLQLKEEKDQATTTIDEQLYLSSLGVAYERDSLNEEAKKLRKEYEDKFSEMKEKYEENLEGVHSYYREKLAEEGRKYSASCFVCSHHLI